MWFSVIECEHLIKVAWQPVGGCTRLAISEVPIEPMHEQR